MPAAPSGRIQMVYPRVCGGTHVPGPGRQGTPGLSPRVRGNHSARPGVRQSEGSIPACAGEPVVAIFVAAASGVYPRVCGGTLPDDEIRNDEGGLSPRVRGNPPDGQHCDALAGVYPRVCGGTSKAHSARPGMEGLSPRVRGNPQNRPLPTRPSGSIPACAGEPEPHGIVSGAWTVYPRVCGGTYDAIDADRFTVGLSPRVRGNRLRPARPPSGRRVYPRVCGGTCWTASAWRGTRGLSPRVRGNRRHHLRGKVPQRSIPACAGEPHTS